MAPCTRCGTPRPASAERCAFCGAPYALAAPPAAPAAAPAAAPGPAPWDPQPWTAQSSSTTQTLTPTRPAAGADDDLTAVARLTGLVLGPYLGVCLLLSLLLSVTFSQGVLDGPMDWLRGAVLLAGMGLHGSVFAEAGGPVSGSSTLTATPALLLAFACGTAFWTGRREELRSLSRDDRHALLRGGLAGVGAAFVLTVLALATRTSQDLGFGFVSGPDVTAGVSALPVLLWGSALLGTAAALGRSHAHRRVLDHPGLLEQLAAATRGATGWLPFAALQLGLSAVVMAAVSFGYVANDLGDATGQTLLSPGPLLAFLLVSVNLGVYASALLMGIAGKASASSGFFGGAGGDTTGGLLHGDLSGGDLVWLVVPLTAALLAGAAASYRRPESAWWHGGTAFLVVWSVSLLLLRVSGSLSGDGETMRFGVGPALLSMVLASFAYGCLAQHGGRAIAPWLRSTLPGLAKQLGA